MAKWKEIEKSIYCSIFLNGWIGSLILIKPLNFWTKHTLSCFICSLLAFQLKTFFLWNFIHWKLSCLASKVLNLVWNLLNQFVLWKKFGFPKYSTSYQNSFFFDFLFTMLFLILLFLCLISFLTSTASFSIRQCSV